MLIIKITRKTEIRVVKMCHRDLFKFSTRSAKRGPVVEFINIDNGLLFEKRGVVIVKNTQNIEVQFLKKDLLTGSKIEKRFVIID